MSFKTIALVFSLAAFLPTPFTAGACPAHQEAAKTHHKTSNPLKVVVSITPFYSLVAGVMDKIGTPVLLVNPGTSPHDYALKPSEMRTINQADIFFWGDPALETFLVKPLENLKSQHVERPTSVIQLSHAPGLKLLNTRTGAAWDHTECTHDEHAGQDMHFWLDPQNALLMIDQIIKSLALVDPNNASHYQQNGAALKAHLTQLDRALNKQLAAVRNHPFIVFHDAYHYFEHRYDLKGVGAIALHPEIPPSAQRLKTIRSIIEKTKAQCVFAEPQFHPKLVHSITSDLPVKTGVLDPIGQAKENNPEGYFTLLKTIADSLENCLGSDTR